MAIVCVGETEAERDAGATLARVGAQLAGSIPDGATPERLVVAYEPVWAIGTGRTPSLNEIAEVHDFMRERLSDRFGADTGGGDPPALRRIGQARQRRRDLRRRRTSTARWSAAPR